MTRRVDVNSSNPGVAVVRLDSDLVEYIVGVDQSHINGVGFACLSDDCAVQVFFTGDDDEATDRLANLALAVITWLRDKRPDHECHSMFEAELGISMPEAAAR